MLRIFAALRTSSSIVCFALFGAAYRTKDFQRHSCEEERVVLKYHGNVSLLGDHPQYPYRRCESSPR